MWNHTIFSWLSEPSISTSMLDGKVALLHIGKTAGSELSRRLWLYRTDHLLFLTHDFAQEVFKHRRCRLGRNRQFVFFVRNPVRRFVSGWIERYRMGRPTYYEAHSSLEAHSFARFPTPDTLGCALSSTDRAVARSAENAMNAHRHVQGLSRYLGNTSNVAACRDRVLFVGRAEHLDQDYPRLLDILRVQNVLAGRPALQNSEGRFHATPHELTPLMHLGTCALNNLRSWFRDDYHTIKYLVRQGMLPTSYLAELTTPT